MRRAATYDFIIVGAGSAGCVLANRLSADPAHSVLLLEAGADERRKEISIPAAWTKLFKSSCDWAYETEPNPGLQGRRLYVPRGKALGGTSSINAMMYVRGNRADFDAWADDTDASWGYEQVLPYFRKSEANSRGESHYHGASGPLAVSDQRDPNELSHAFVEAAAEAGIPRNADCNGATQDGAGLVQVTMRNARRCSAAHAFLYPAMGRPNLRVLPGAHVTQVLFELRRAVGVKYVQNGGEQIVRAGREVLLAGGAFNSPQLLMLSGIGPADHVRQFASDVVADLPGVGANLQEHAAGALRVRCPKPLSLAGAESLANLGRYLVLRRGMLSSNGAEAVAFAHSRAGPGAPDIEIIFLPAVWQNQGLTPPPEHGFTLAVMLLQPLSRGSVRLASRDPRAAPVIHMNLLSDPAGQDLRTIVAGLRIARRIASASAMRPFHGGEILLGADATSDADLAAAVRAEGQAVYHPVGTCRMGTDDLAVVDPGLRVRGVDGLRVIDASVMPRVVRGHTHASAMMIAEKGADLVLGVRSREARVAESRAG
ncbi:MAG: GMC family oxidoreductase [Gemmatimonadaceae bacterium]